MKSLSILVLLVLALPLRIPPASATSLTASDYARAEKLLDQNARGLLQGAVIVPHWLPGSDTFWYRSDIRKTWVLFDCRTGRRSEPVDPDRLAAALTAAGRDSISRGDLSLIGVEPAEGGFTVRARAGRREYTCSVPGYHCEATGPAKEADPTEMVSPDGLLALTAPDNDFRLTDRKTGRERRLTKDGEAYFAYGKWPDASLQTIPWLRSKTAREPYGVRWSPDSRYVVGQRFDERAIATYPFVEWVPQDGSYRPSVYDLRLALLGDAEQGQVEAFAIDVRTGRKSVIRLPEGWTFSEPDIAWADDGRHFFGLAATPGDRRMALVETDVSSGRTRFVIEEESPTHVELNQFLYSAPNVRLLQGGREALWFSQRDGWGHLYLYDTATGALKRRLTSGKWLVRDIVRVDEQKGYVYFTAGGREAGRDPYYRHLYRVPLDGGDVTLLTPEDADHEFMGPIASMIASSTSYIVPETISPSGDYVVDTYSTVDAPPVTVVRSVARPDQPFELERADASRLLAAGYRPPERFRTRAADGTTEIYGVIYYPPGYDNKRFYPVIDALYAGPQVINAPRNYVGAVASTNPVCRASLAQLGFIVVTVDGRGTPGRSKAYHDVSYGIFADPQIEDHVAAIRQLAPGRGFDLDRVGVYGHSFGGYASVRALLLHPEFYKVGVSSAGPQVFESMYVGLEILLAVPAYAGGGGVRPSATASPEPYHSMDNRALAERLAGKLLLAYGDMDENALPSATLQLVDALVKANKSYDLLYLPNRTHSLVRDPYFQRRLWDYFVENLLGAEPPENYEIGAKKPAGSVSP